MDQYYDTEDDGRGDDIDIDTDQVVPGQEAYDFTNAELARSLDDPSVPISYVIFKLIKAAPWFWKNSKTANCVLKIPLSPPGVSTVALRNRTNLSPSMGSSTFGQGRRAWVDSAAPILSSQRVVSQPNPSSPVVMTIALHMEYLLPQSMLFRAVFPGSPHLHLITRIFSEEKEHAFDFSPPWSPFTWPAWRTPRVVPHTNGLPTAIVPVPHPPSLFAVVHYLYFGDLDALGEYIRTGTIPQSNTNTGSSSQRTGTSSPLGPGTGLFGGTQATHPIPDPSPRSPTSPTRRRPPHSPLPLNSDAANPYNAQATRLPPTSVPTSTTASSPSSSKNLEAFTIRWQGVVNNAEYLGLPVRLRTWLSLFWDQDYPNVEMPIFHEEVYFAPSSLSPSPSPSPSRSLAHERESLGRDDDGGNGSEDDGSDDDYYYDSEARGVKSPRTGISKPAEHSPIARSSLSPRKHDWRARAAYK